MAETLWGPIDTAQWRFIRCIEGRLAVEADMKSGQAVFYLQHVDAPDAAPIQMDLPALAVFRGEDGVSRVVVAIQAERSFEKHLVGFRFLDGGNGMCTLEELEWIDDTDPRFHTVT